MKEYLQARTCTTWETEDKYKNINYLHVTDSVDKYKDINYLHVTDSVVQLPSKDIIYTSKKNFKLTYQFFSCNTLIQWFSENVLWSRK